MLGTLRPSGLLDSCGTCEEVEWVVKGGEKYAFLGARVSGVFDREVDE